MLMDTARPGGFWLRLVAFIVDAVLITMFLIGIQSYLPINPRSPAFEGVSILIFWLYFALLESSHFEGTIGKMAAHLKVTDYGGRRISFLHATARYFAGWVSATIFCVGFLIIAFTKRKQGLHDFMTRTIVVRV